MSTQGAATPLYQTVPSMVCVQVQVSFATAADGDRICDLAKQLHGPNMGNFLWIHVCKAGHLAR